MTVFCFFVLGCSFAGTALLTGLVIGRRSTLTYSVGKYNNKNENDNRFESGFGNFMNEPVPHLSVVAHDNKSS